MDWARLMVHAYRCRAGSAWRIALAMALLLGWSSAAWSQSATGEEGALLRRSFDTLRDAMRDLPSFLRDTQLNLHLRTYYFLREKPDGGDQEAWAGGGWLAYRSGWLLDAFGLGTTFYGSGPLYAPDDRDGTLLLKPGQEGYYVLGEAFAALRYRDYGLLKGYRQEFTQTYINIQDSRMTPNTFEALTLGGTAGPVQYLAGYLWAIKPRNADRFVSMAEQAGAKDGDDGVAVIGVKLAPLPGLRIEASEQYGVNTFSTAFAQAEYTHPLARDLKLFFGGQFTDQRAVGDALVANSAFPRWVTQNGSGKVRLSYRDLTVTAGFSLTASGNKIQTPWGGYPGYLSLIQEDFNRANEKAWLLGVAYDFSTLITPGISAVVNFAWGADAIDPVTRRPAPDRAEYDLTIDYRPPRVKGLWIRLRGLVFDQEGSDRLGYQIRVVLNWEIPLL